MTQPIHPMLERVARAIALQQFPVDAPTINKRGWVERHWRLYLDHARAAIQALMEPSQDMIWEGDDCYSVARGTESWTIAGCKGSEQIWTAMLKPLLGDEGALSRSEERPRQPVPGIYNEEQRAAGFVAKEVG